MKTAAELGIPEAWRASLVLVRDGLRDGSLKHVKNLQSSGGFNMNWWRIHTDDNCGTVCCIGGWAEKLGGVRFPGLGESKVAYPALENLFYPEGVGFYSDITTEQGASALQNYLDTGRAQWKEVLSCK